MTGDNSSLPNNNSTQCSHWTPLQQHHRSTAAVAQLLCDGRDAVTCDAMRPGLVLVLCLGLGLGSVSAQGGFFSNILNRFNPFRQPQQPARPARPARPSRPAAPSFNPAPVSRPSPPSSGGGIVEIPAPSLAQQQSGGGRGNHQWQGRSYLLSWR